MHPDHKKILRAVSLELRHTLEGQYDDQGRFQPGDLERRLNEIGLWRDRPAKPLGELPHLSPEDRQARQVVDAYLDFRQEAGVPRAEAVAEFVREAAYTWANRLLTLRCMEARGIIDEVILQKEVYGWRSMVHNRFARRNPAACAGEDDGLFAVLLAEFAERAAELPHLFHPTSPATALRPSIPALKRCIALLSGRESARSQPAATDEVFAAPDALGWTYQYWNAEEKDRVFEKVRTQKGAKIEGSDIIPATQLYTEPYMVKFLVQNSLGATWLGMHPDSKLAEGWEYFVKDADRAPLVPDPLPFAPTGRGPTPPGGDYRPGLWTRSNPALTDWPSIAEYALTFDGYDYCEKVWRVEPLSGEGWNKVETFRQGETWTGNFEDLRACLFMVQRGVKWSGGSGPTDDLEASGIRLYRAICAAWDREWPQRRPILVKPISEITFLDPAAGSGHFLLEAFDLFYQMYEEEGTRGWGLETRGQGLEARGQGLEATSLSSLAPSPSSLAPNKGETDASEKLSRSESVASQYDTGRASLSPDPEFSSRGEIWSDQPDASRGSVGSIEYRGGPRQSLDTGVSPSSLDSPGLASRVGDPTVSSGTTEIHSSDSPGPDLSSGRRSWEDAARSAEGFGKESLGAEGLGASGEGLAPNPQPLTPGQICASILNNNLFGIDIDERAIQIAQAALWMKAKEKGLGAEGLEARAEGLAPNPYPLAPFFSHLVATNIRLPRGKDHLEAFLQQHPEDRDLRPALETVFEGLANAHELGSLLQIEEPVEKELRYLQAKAEERRGKPEQLGMFAEFATPKQGELPLGVENYDDWQARTLTRLKAHFETEAEAADLSRAFFGQVAGKGLALFDLLTLRYDVVAANPPYMGSKNMGRVMQNYLEAHYPTGKRDLYSSFIEFGLNLLQGSGRIAFVTQQSWMFLDSFKELRSILHSQGGYEVMCHLGPRTFPDLSNTNALGFTMFCWAKSISPYAKGCFIRLVHDTDKEDHLRKSLESISQNNPDLIRIYHASSSQMQAISGESLFYWAPDTVLEMFADERVNISNLAVAKQGLATGDNNRFMRFNWETFFSRLRNRWVPYTKGGPYRRWYGNEWYVVDWEKDGTRLKATTIASGKLKSRPQNQSYYFKPGITWTAQSSYGFSTRYLPEGQIFGAKGPALFPKDHTLIQFLLGVSNTFFFQYLFTGIQPVVDFGEGYLMSLPVPKGEQEITSQIADLAELNLLLKRFISSTELTELQFHPKNPQLHNSLWFSLLGCTAIIHSAEGCIAKSVNRLYKLTAKDLKVISFEMGTPTGWHPLLAGYDQLPLLPEGLTEIPLELLDSLQNHQRLILVPAELDDLKNRLRPLYEAGPGAKTDDLDLEVLDDEDEENEVAGAHIPIPTETFLEELSVKLQIHPISVYWLLKEGREKEGWRCRPEEKRLTEDRFTVIVLRLLGHRWPRQIEAGEPVPEWADADGIIPLTSSTDQSTLLDRVRERLGAREKGLEARGQGPVSTPQSLTPSPQSLEREFAEIVGETLEKWLTGSFFKRHISQFKKRPIAWQLESRGQRLGIRGKGPAPSPKSLTPAFSCLIYYHKLDGDLLPKLRSQYVGPLRSRYETELHTLERIEFPTPDQAGRKLQLESWIVELKTFEETLNRMIVDGFGPDDAPALRAWLRQLAVDEAVLSLKGRWLERLAEVIRSGPLAGWQEAARATHLSPDFPTWIADALIRLDYACTQVGPPPPILSALPAEPTAADLSRIICEDSKLMVEQTLAVICARWQATLEQKLITPIRNQIQYVLDRAVDARTAEATVKRLKKEIEDITARGRQVEKQILAWRYPDAGELADWLAGQPLYDAVSSLDGRRDPPSTLTDFVRQESTYVPDLNDGVRVNIVPLQRAGLLAAEVLARKDIDTAIADRAEWRADERRWCREGKLPRPGWWEERLQT